MWEQHEGSGQYATGSSVGGPEKLKEVLNPGLTGEQAHCGGGGPGDGEGAGEGGPGVEEPGATLRGAGGNLAVTGTVGQKGRRCKAQGADQLQREVGKGQYCERETAAEGRSRQVGQRTTRGCLGNKGEQKYVRVERGQALGGGAAMSQSRVSEQFETSAGCVRAGVAQVKEIQRSQTSCRHRWVDPATRGARRPRQRRLRRRLEIAVQLEGARAVRGGNLRERVEGAGTGRTRPGRRACRRPMKLWWLQTRRSRG